MKSPDPEDKRILREYLADLAAIKQLIIEPEVPQETIPESKKLSYEMIFRKTFVDILKEYGHNCSLAGVQKMCDPDIGVWERLIRVLVFLTALGTSCYFLLYIWSNTLTNPLIVTMESSTYPISAIDFPAVALCNVNRISMKALKQLAREEYEDLAKRREPIEEVEAVLLQWGRLLDFSYNETIRKNRIYQRLVEKYSLDTDRITALMKKLAPSCEDQLLKCTWEGDTIDCASLFSMRRTSFGHCCTFNFIMNVDPTQKTIRRVSETKHQKEGGYKFGLVVILDPMLEDYAYSLSKTLGFDVLIFPTHHYPDPKSGRVVHRKAEPNMGVFLELKSTKQVATKEVRKYGLKTRNCLYHNEMPDTFSDMYSYSSCIVFCRAMTIQSLCKCSPYFVAYRGIIESPICTLDNLRCLNKYKEKLSYLYPMRTTDPTGLEIEIQDSLFCEECYPDCELTSYSTKSYESSMLNAYDPAKNFVNSFLDSINMTNKIFLSIYHPNYDATLDRLDVVNYWYEIVSNVGGFGGIVVGFSIISVVEIIFFFTIRFYQQFYKNFLKYH